MAVARSRLVLPVTMHFSLCSFCLSAGPRCWHHGFCGFHEVAALVVDNRSGMFYAGFTGNDTLRAVLTFVGRSATRCSWHVHGWFCWFMSILRCSLVCRQAVMPASWLVFSSRCYARCAQRQVPWFFVAYAATSSSSPF